MHEELAKRVAQLERMVRRLAMSCAAAVALLVGVAAMGFARGGGSDGPVDLRVTRLQVVDDAGRIVLTLGANASGGVVAVQGADGALVATLASTRSGSGLLALADGKGGRLVEISGRPDGGGGVVNLFGGKAESPAVAIAADGGDGTVSLYTKEALPAAVLGRTDGASRLVVFGPDGKTARMFVVEPQR